METKISPRDEQRRKQAGRFKGYIMSAARGEHDSEDRLLISTSSHDYRWT